MTVLLASVVDVTVVLALGLFIASLLKRQSAAVRHAVLTIAIVCAVLMPILELTLPQLPIVDWFDRTPESSGLMFASEPPLAGSATLTSASSPLHIIDWPMVLAGAWAAATLLTFVALVMSVWRLRRLRTSCSEPSEDWRSLTDSLASECGIRRRVDVLQSDDPTLLVTYGTLRPGIILPAGTESWPEDRRRVALRHELAHIARCDSAIQMSGEFLRVMQPFNPLVWIACRQLRQQSEYACDDAVLSAGVNATDYATHLFDVATQLSGRQTIWASAPAIAHPSTLERRIIAMLQHHPHRQPFTRRGWAIAGALALGVSLPLAAAGLTPPPVTPPQNPMAVPAVLTTRSAPVINNVPPSPAVTRPRTVRPAQASLSGQVQDQTGGRIPGATVTLTNLETKDSVVATTNATGRFQFEPLAPAVHLLVTELSGFRKVQMSVDLSKSSPLNVTVTLPVGALSEAVNVKCGPTTSPLFQSFFPTLSAQERPSTPIRIGGQIKPPKKLKDVRPVCPAVGVTGNMVVILEANIGVDGLVNNLRSIRTGVPAELVESAIDAVHQWEFSPTMLNGQPVEVVMTVTVNFQGR